MKLNFSWDYFSTVADRSAGSVCNEVIRFKKAAEKFLVFSVEF
jgi:hypothetical protein